MLELSNIGIFTAFVAGLTSFLSPCVPPLVPGYVSYIAGRSLKDGPAGGSIALRLPALGLSSCFVLGFDGVRPPGRERHSPRADAAGPSSPKLLTAPIWYGFLVD